MSCKRVHKFRRQEFEYARQMKQLRQYERNFRLEVQHQLQDRVQDRVMRRRNENELDTTPEKLEKGLKKLRMTNSLRGQLAKIQRVRRTMKLENTTINGVVCGL